MIANVLIGNLSFLATLLFMVCTLSFLVGIWLGDFKEKDDPWEPDRPDPFVLTRSERIRNKREALVRFLLGRPPYTPPWEK